MNWEILDQVDDEFSLFDDKDPSRGTESAKKIENFFLENSGNNINCRK